MYLLEDQVGGRAQNGLRKYTSWQKQNIQAFEVTIIVHLILVTGNEK